MSDLLHVSAAPHSRSPVTTKSIMRDVAIALVPAGLFGVFNFGIHALMVIVVTVLACVLTEFIYCKYMKKTPTVGDYSAVVTGILLAYNVPAGFPLWMAAIGGIFAILVVKMVFGGIGQNIMNPALAARAFLLISFPARMTNFDVAKVTSPGVSDYIQNGYMAVDGLSGATPLAAIKAGESFDLFKMFIGQTGGTIGETSVIALLIGVAYLVFKKIISLRIPLTYIVTVAIFVLIFGGQGFDMNYMLGQVLGGGLILGAFFMATDYTTSPITATGQIAYGIILGLLTGLFRQLGGSAEGVSYAIIFGNLLVPLIDKMTRSRAFGKERVVRE